MLAILFTQQNRMKTVQILMTSQNYYLKKIFRSHFILIPLTLCFLFIKPLHALERVSYMVLAETVEPIMIVKDGDPMAGGIMTEIVKLIFQHSDYQIEPVVLPWQRMQEEFKISNDWVTHGIPNSFNKDIPFEMSKLPIFPFNHSAVTLKKHDISINTLEDLRNQDLILVENFHYAKLDEFIQSEQQKDKSSSIGVLRAFTPAGTLGMLKHERGDVVIDWQVRILYNLPGAGLDIDDIDFHDASKIVPTKNVHLAFSSHQSEKFRTFVNLRIKQLTDSGQLQDIVEEYYKPVTPPINWPSR